MSVEKRPIKNCDINKCSGYIPFSVRSLSNYNRTELQVSIFIIFPWPSVIFLLKSISAYWENVLIFNSDMVLFVTTDHLWSCINRTARGDVKWQSMVPTRQEGHLLSNNTNLYIEDNIPWKRTFNYKGWTLNKDDV